MAANRNNEPIRPIEIEIQAKDSASKVLKDTSVAFAKLKEESNAVSKSLGLAGSSLATVAAFADTARLKVLDTSTAMAGLGVATVTTVGLITSKITGLFSVVNEIRKTVQENPVSNSFFSMIAQQAEEAISETASLSDSIRAIGNIAVPFGEGFTREILKLDTTPVSKKISDSVSQGVRGITGAIFNPIEEKLGFSIFTATQKGIGTALQSLDKSLAQTAIASFFDFTVGSGPVRSLVEGIATSPAIAQYSPKFIQALLGGSASAAVDELTGSIAGLIQGQISGGSPLANLIIGTGFNRQIEALAGTQVRTVFQGLNAQLADFTLENRIIDIIGNKTSAAFVKGIIKQPLVTNILNTTVQALATGNFTEAIALSLETSLSKTINDAFESANRQIAKFSTAAGRASLSRILDSGANAKAQARLKELKDGLEEEKNILDARKILVEDNFKLDERTLTNAINEKQRSVQNPTINNAQRQELETSLVSLTSQLTRLRSQQSRELAKLEGEYKIYESRVRATSTEISELERFLDRNTRTQAIAGNTFSGIGERFLKGIGFGSKISLTNKILPLIFDLSTGGAGGALSGIIGNQFTDAFDKIFPEVNESISGFAREITRISVVDNAIGSGIASAGGRAIDALIPRLLSPIINNSIDGVERLGGRLISDRLSKFFPPLFQTAIANGLNDTGASKAIFKKIIESLNPQTLKTNLQSLSAGFGTLQDSIVPVLSSIEAFTIKALFSVQRAVLATANIIPAVQTKITQFLSIATSALDGLKLQAVNAYSAIISITNQAAGGTTNLLGGVIQFLDRLKSGQSSGTKIAIIETLQNGVSKAIDAIGFLKARILSLNDSGLTASFSVIDKLKNILNTTGADISAGLPAQITRLYQGVNQAINSVTRNGLFNPKAIQDNIQLIRNAIDSAIPGIDAFSATLSTKAQEIRDGLNKVLGDSAERFGNFIGNLFDENTTDQTAIKFKSLFTPFKDIFNDLFKLSAQQGQRSFLSGILGEGFDRIAPALNLIDRSIVNVYRSISTVASRTSQALDVFSLIPGKFAGFNEPLAVFGYFEQTIGSVAGGISFLSEKLSFFTQGLSSLQQLTQGGPFKLLIGQTVELREQLLATQASLVGTSTIFNKFTGQEIKDPTAAIKSLDLPILSQIEQLRKESLKLVGVTSKDLVPLYQQVASRITSIGGSLTDAKNLALDFAASLGTLNIPLAQSQQEISSILTGQIDQNSALAKSLSITNEQVNLYKSQGRLVEELRKRLEAFRAGNELAAQSLGGITSNIQEIFDEIGRKAGQSLLDPLLKQVSAVYEFLNQNQQQLIAYFGQFSDYMLRIGGAITDSLKTVAKSFQGLIVQAPIYLFKSLTNAVEAFNGAIQFAAQALAPVVNTLSAMLSVAGALGGPLLGLFLTTKVLSTAVSTLGDMFGVVTQLIPGLGELLFFLDVRSEGVINQFANLSKILGVGASGFLILGKNLESIPGAVGVINQALGPVGGLVAGFIPTISGVGIQLAGLIAIFPVLGSVLSNFITQAPVMARAIATLATTSIYTAPLAPLFTQAAVGLDLYADASTRQAIIGGQLTEVLRSIGKAVASNVLTLGFLAAGTYAAFLAFDAFVLKNETVRQVLSAVGDGLKTLGGIIADVFGNEMTRGIAIATTLAGVIALGLIPSVRTLIALQLGTWAGAAAGGLNALSKAAALLGATNLAASLLSSSVGLATIQVLFTSGSAAATSFAASNGLVVGALKFLPPSLAAATTGLSVFTGALYAALLPLLPIIGTVALVVSAIAGIGLAVQKQKLGEGIAEVEEYGRQLEDASDQSLKLVQSLKRAGDAQAEANKRGVQLSKEQYAENAKLLKQTELQSARLDDEIKNRQEALKDIRGDENKAALQAQIDDLKRQKEQLLRLSGDAIQTQPKEILDKGSVFEQLRIKAEGAKAAIEKPADDTALKQKSQELIEITQQQLELGAITAEEARKNLSQVADNAKVEQDVRVKAQKAIADSYKATSAIITEGLKAETELINAQLAAGVLNFADNAKAIADIQNSALEDRMTNEEAAHKATMKRLQDEYEGKKLLLEQDLLSAQIAASKNAGTEEGNKQLAKAEEFAKQLQQLEAKRNQDTEEEGKRNAEANAALTKEIADNQAKQYQLAKDLEKQVRDGSISEEQAALRQSAEAKKAELAAQTKSIEDAYKKQKEIINQQFEQDRNAAEKQLNEKFKELAKLVPGSDAYIKVAQDAIALNAKIESSQASTKQALIKADRDFNTESAKLQTQSLQAQTDNEKKQRDAAIKFLDTKQKEAQDVLQKSQNQQLINIQKLETAGLSIKEQSEFQKTKLTGEQIANQLRQEEEKLKKLESLQKPKGQQERLALDAQIRASRLKTQDLIRQGLENEQKAYDGTINLVKANIKLEGEAKETKLERQRLTLGEAAIAQTLARQKVADLEKELSKETKNIARRSALILELEKARTAARRAGIAGELNDFDNATAQLQAGLEGRYRNGQASESRIKVIEAQRAVERAQKELDLEKDNVDKKYRLQLALEKAKTALLDAQIAERQKLIETENQEYLNQIEEQNQAIKRQSMLYEVMASALTERNKVLEASKNLAAAAAGFMTSELDVLSKIETSEYRRKQLAEIAAAIKLEALAKQQEFERESLENQILQNKYALEREAIQNRINQATKIAEIAKQQAEIEVFKADPRNESRSGRAQLRAKELALEANQYGLVQLGLQGGLIQKQQGGQDELAKMQRRSLELKQKGDERQAQAELINALPPGRKQRAARAFGKQIAEEQGYGSVRELINAGLATSRGRIKKDFGITPSIDLLGAVDPELAGLLENLYPSQRAAAIGNVQSNFDKQYGGTQSLSNVSSPNPTGKPLQLLPEFQGKLTLPSPTQRGSSIVNLEKAGNLFQTGVEKLIDYLDGQKKDSKGTSYNINITSPVGNTSTSGTANKVSTLEDTLRIAKQLAGIR